MVRILSFSGRKHSGKTMLCDISRVYGYETMYFADGLKNLICEMMGIERDVLEVSKDSPQEIDLSSQTTFLAERLELDKISTIELLRLESPFASIREVMQYIGTDLIRKYCPNWHISQLEKQIKNHIGDKICVGDCRFENEKEFIEQLGGETWIIVRPNYLEDISNHSSETSLQWNMFGERVIINNKDTETLKTKWTEYLETGMWTPSEFIHQKEVHSQFKHESVISFIKNSTKNNAKRMACIIDNPLLLEDLKLLL